MNGDEMIKKAYDAILHHDFDKAISWFEEAIMKEPENAAFHHKLSISYARSGKLNKAVEHAEIACMLDKQQEEYRFHLKTLQAMKMTQKAEQLLKENPEQVHRVQKMLIEALRLDPLCSSAHVFLGVAYAQQQQFDLANQHLNEAIKLDPKNAAALEWLKYLEQQSNHK